MVKRKIIWSPGANLDFLKILEFFKKRNETKAYSKKLYLKIHKSVRLLSKHPFLGIQTDDENIRNLIEGDYAIFYKLDEESVYILSVWDCRQDPESLNVINK
jgi:plasmid stabilization system protein ParE